MRAHRVALLATWIVVSLFVVAGFANFSANDPPTTSDSPIPTYDARLGADAGAVSAMAFAFLADQPLAVQAKSAPPEPEEEAEAPAADSSQRSSTTFVRSSILNESTVRDTLSRYFQPEDVARAVRSAWCASNFDPGFQNAETQGAGMFQLSPQQWADHAGAAGVPNGQIVDPGANAAVAAYIVYNVQGGWSNLACSG
ncbi:MAG: hypothetical protein OEX04_15590 [Acidimicrobiia bacterium]|nr:hypothetical protein [Acidimicrobiia bacterium]MDH5292319.1 hypothetical protein [Acidimicrobiia bacterium]